MASPALIVGLGGTGVMVLTLVKRDLLATNKGELPREVKLLAFDTEKKPGFQVGITLGGVTKPICLDDEEYVWIGGNVRDYVRDVAGGDHPQVGSWLQSSYYLDRLPDDIFFLERGAGMLRQFGRLAVFHDVQRGENESHIYAKLNHAMGRVQQATNAPTIQAILVTSVAGGTGAGMFLDIAYLIRRIAEIRLNLGVTLRGLIVLPEAFRRIPSGVTQDMRGRAFAAMRETKRFMVNFDWAVGYPMYYLNPIGVADGRDVWQGRMKSRVFDFFYYLDGRREKNTLEMTKLEDGAAPTLADMIGTFLDDEGGQKFEAHKNNIHQQAGDAAVYSTTGTFSLVLPVYHLTEGFSHRMAQEALDILVPAEEVDRDKIPLRLSFSKNLEEGEGKSGVTAALAFLQVSQVVDVHDAKNQVGAMPFTYQCIHPAMSRYSDQNRDSLVAELASRDLDAWLQFYTPQGAESEAVRKKVEATVKQTVAQTCPPSSQVGDKPSEAVGRMERGVSDYLARHLGQEKEGGRREGGAYRRALEEYQQVHLERFRQMLNLHCTNILNGRSSEDFRKARGGKLGYLYAFLDSLAGVLDTYKTLLNSAREVRETRGERQGALAGALASLHELKAKSKAWIPGQAGRAQATFLESYQRLANVLRIEALETTATNTIQEMYDYVQSARERVQSWSGTLAIGGKSLYADVMAGNGKVRVDRENEEKSLVRQIVPSMDKNSEYYDPTYEEELYKQYVSGTVDRTNEFLGDLIWEVNVAQSGQRNLFDLTLIVRSRQGKPTRLTGEVRADNYNLLLNRCREAFTELWQRETVLKYLRRRFENNATALSNLIYDHGGPLLMYAAPPGGQLKTVPANFLRVTSGAEGDDSFLNVIKDSLAHLAKQDPEKFVQIIRSADPFKMTLVHTVDLVPLEGMRSYLDGQADYLRWRGSGVIAGKGRDILHNFPAEVTAAQYEMRAVEEIQQAPHLFNDDVVVLLENRDRFKLFTLALAHGLIQVQHTSESGGETRSYWQLFLPEEETGDRIHPKAPALDIQLSKPLAGDYPDLLEALGTFEFVGQDLREMARAIDYERVRRALQAARKTKVAQVQLELEPEMEQAIAKLPTEPVDRQTEARDLLTQVQYLKAEREALVEDLYRGRNEEEKRKTATEKLLTYAKGAQRDLYTCFYLALSEEIRSMENTVRQLARL